MILLMPPAEHAVQDALATTLLSNLAAFQAFARRRLVDEQLAADAVQESLLRALKADRKRGRRTTSSPGSTASSAMF
jgi:DNA-directed RNA polymerase specialized sigma24 family protein